MNIAWVIFTMVIVMVLQSVLYQRRGLKKLTYQRSFNRTHVFAKEEVELIDQIGNQKWLPLPWVRLEAKINSKLKIHSTVDATEDNVFHHTLLSLLPYQRITRRHKITCMQRGVYPLQTVALTVGDLLGLQEVFKLYETDVVITVYPELISFDMLPVPAQRFLGDQTVKRWIIEDPFLTVGTRDYQETDSAHRINWKASARTNQLQANIHDYTADHNLTILFNADQSEDIWMPIQDQSLFEQAVSYVATIAHYAIENGERVGFLTNAVLEEDKHKEVNKKPFVQVDAKTGHAHCYYLFEVLAQLTYERSQNFHYLLESINKQDIKQTDFLIITTQTNVKMEQAINQLRSHGNTVETLILDGKVEEALA